MRHFVILNASLIPKFPGGVMFTHSVATVAPLRISFVGGGTDISTFYTEEKGAVVSASINKYVYIHAKNHDESFGEKYRISYSSIEHVNSVGEIRNNIVRSCLELLDFRKPIQISISSDLPFGTGLGSSSSLTVALLLALHTLRGEVPSKRQLAEEACYVEIEMLEQPIGKQDQYAATFGGLNMLEFHKNGRVTIDPIDIKHSELSELEKRITLFWTGIQRDATSVLKDQIKRSSINKMALSQLAEEAIRFQSILQRQPIDWKELARIISTTWEIKASLSPKIVQGNLLTLVQLVKDRFENGVKLLGAGSGGFILGFDGSEMDETGLQGGIESRMQSIKPRIDLMGARITSMFVS